MLTGSDIERMNDDCIKKTVNSNVDTPLNEFLYLQELKMYGNFSMAFSNDFIFEKIAYNPITYVDPIIKCMDIFNKAYSKSLKLNLLLKALISSNNPFLDNDISLEQVVNNETLMKEIVSNERVFGVLLSNVKFFNGFINSAISMKVIANNQKSINAILLNSEFMVACESSEIAKLALSESTLAYSSSSYAYNYGERTILNGACWVISANGTTGYNSVYIKTFAKDPLRVQVNSPDIVVNRFIPYSFQADVDHNAITIGYKIIRRLI